MSSPPSPRPSSDLRANRGAGRLAVGWSGGEDVVVTRTSKRVDLPAEVDGECVFCLILDGRSPASMVAERERAVAFMDLQPAVPGHLLVIPRVHAPGLAELDDADGAAVFALGSHIARRLRASGLAQGVNFLLADGVAAGQEVWHVHLHVLPRRPGDGMGFTADWRSPQRAELDEGAARVRAALTSLA